jgi:hypothetical protein
LERGEWTEPGTAFPEQLAKRLIADFWDKAERNPGLVIRNSGHQVILKTAAAGVPAAEIGVGDRLRITRRVEYFYWALRFHHERKRYAIEGPEYHE